MLVYKQIYLSNIIFVVADRRQTCHNRPSPTFRTQLLMFIDYDAFLSFLRRRYFTSPLKRIVKSRIFQSKLPLSRRAPIVAFILVCMVPSLVQSQDTRSLLSVPQGWRIENTTYPPPWAKSLPWKGKIELRFPPGFFQATSNYFWSYPSLYQLQGNCITNDTELKLALLEYDAGLYGGKYSRDQIDITVSNHKKRPRGQPHILIFKGFDPFTTKQPLTTYLEIQRRYDGVSDMTTILILRSARPIDKRDAVWKTLYRFRKDAGF